MAARLIQAKVIPGARREEIIWTGPDACRVKLTAPPVDGKANEALVLFLAETLGVRRSRVSIVRGHTSRLKTVAVDGD